MPQIENTMRSVTILQLWFGCSTSKAVHLCFLCALPLVSHRFLLCPVFLEQQGARMLHFDVLLENVPKMQKRNRSLWVTADDLHKNDEYTALHPYCSAAATNGHKYRENCAKHSSAAFQNKNTPLL